MQNKIITFHDIGDVRFIKSRRAKKVSIRVISHDNVRVSVPVRESFSTAKSFVVENSSWIKKHVERLNKVQTNKILFDHDTPFKTKNHSLRIIQSPNDKCSVKISDVEIFVNYPVGVSIYSESVQSLIHRGIEDALRIEAKEYIPARVSELAELYHFKYNRIFVKNIRSRWGSCSRKGNINFSLHLMMLPGELIDYVILHELAHTLEHNHSKSFWAILDNIYGNSKAIDKKLKNYAIGFYGAGKEAEF
jgi:predicted metal-dependent hydrolase